jgi:hypothetical protein
VARKRLPRAPGWQLGSALVLIPVILVLADLAATSTSFKFLLLPPFGALTYLMFVNPARVEMNVRRIIVCPTATAALAWILATTIGYNALSVALAMAGTMLIMWVLDAYMIVPPLALALLTILLHDQVRGHPDYILSVFIFTVAVYGVYLAWLRLPLGSREDAPGRTSADGD